MSRRKWYRRERLYTLYHVAISFDLQPLCWLEHLSEFLKTLPLTVCRSLHKQILLEKRYIGNMTLFCSLVLKSDSQESSWFCWFSYSCLFDIASLIDCCFMILDLSIKISLFSLKIEDYRRLYRSGRAILMSKTLLEDDLEALRSDNA